MAALIRKGYSPSQIARELKSSESDQPLTISSVKGYLWRAVGEGQIKPSDIVFAIPRNMREKIEGLIAKHGTLSNPPHIFEEIKRANLDPDDAEIYLNLRRAVYGDLYGLLHEIEVHLHTIIRNTLIAEYGEGDWWSNGVYKKIRDKCEGYGSVDKVQGQKDILYRYTSLYDLLTILKTQWPIVSRVLPSKVVSDRDKFIVDLERLIKLRNAVMHPVKGVVPTKEDYNFAQGVYSTLLGMTPRI